MENVFARRDSVEWIALLRDVQMRVLEMENAKKMENANVKKISKVMIVQPENAKIIVMGKENVKKEFAFA